MPIELYSQEQARLAKAGQPDVYRYDEFPQTFRQQIVFIWKRSVGEYGSYHDNFGRQENPGNFVWDDIEAALAEEYGLAELHQGGNALFKCQNFLRMGDAHQVLDIIQFTFQQVEQYSRGTGRIIEPSVCKQAISDLNRRFQEHSLGFEFTSGRIISKSIEYIHVQAVKPALSLLTLRGFSGVSDEFLRAHGHFLKGEYQDAILDANNAFESTMKVICDLRGWPFAKTDTASKLIGVMFGNDLIPAYLTSQFDHLRLTLEAGLPTARNKVAGHGHGSAPVTVPEYLAAFALHLAASNIVLLVEAHKAKP